ncbi:MAG: hypothetical protein C4582_02730 [Desulfobacteraceae bacterium]|nr:MAG: hypothetical protein C4582_02730 [Desulfobacteraceae bacterium]
MKKQWIALVVMIFITICAWSPAIWAGQSAIEKLIEIFEQRGALTPSEAAAIKASLVSEQEELRQIKKQLEQKQKELDEREIKLKAGERTPTPAQQISGGEGAGLSAVSERKETPVPKEEAKKETQEKESIRLEPVYRDGFCLESGDGNLFSMCLGGALQSDYRYYDYQDADPDKNRFDIRRARLLLSGKMLRNFGYKFQYEFQGAGSRRLLDAYVDTELMPFVSLKAGQFKEPFGLEHMTDDEEIPFAERSMGFYLTPQRDVGASAHGSVWNGRIHYGFGLFNGDGQDDATGGDVDSPEFAGRLVLEPFKGLGLTLLEGLQLGGSLSYASIDRNNVQIGVKTAGLTTFFDVASMAKFNIIRQADSRRRYGVELGWTYGPLMLMGEYFSLNYYDVATSSSSFDIKIEDYYVSLLWMITGEKPRFKDGVFQRIEPGKKVFFNGWGGLGLALRYDVFEADESVYDTLIRTGDSVRKAEAYSIALNWFLNEYARLILDFTRTEFDLPLLILRDPLTGTSIYSDKEDVITARFQIGF